MGFWKFGRLRSWSGGGRRTSAPDAAWWAKADAAAIDPRPDLVDELRLAASAVTDVDERERIDEMLEGLENLVAIAVNTTLPIVSTQHRVIGADVCHFVAPASLVGPTEASGKLFVTSARLVFAGPRVTAWPWHRITRLVRQARSIAPVIAGGADAPAILCNSYGDAMIVAHLAERLKR